MFCNSYFLIKFFLSPKHSPWHLTNFVTYSGRHTPTTFLRDMGFKEFVGTCKVPSAALSGKFKTAHDFFTLLHTATNMISFVNKVHTGVLKNSDSSVLNPEVSSLPFVSEAESTPLGKNDSVYYKINVHTGKVTSKKILRIQDGPFVETLKKVTSSSSSDYLSHDARNRLVLKCGFNQKGFSFLMEDTYFSISDYYQLFQIDERFKKYFKSDKNGIKDIYGCVLKTKNKLKIV